jgi:hypothetical protein
MRVASGLLTLIINLGLGLGAASDLGSTRSSPAATHAAVTHRSCPFVHRDKASHPISPSHYLAAVRMGWTLG